MIMEYYANPQTREELSTVMEMNTLSSIEDFTVRKEKLSLKEGNSNKGHMLIFLNTSKQEIVKILNNEYKLIVNQGTTYKGYYYDHIRLRTSIKTTRVKNPGKSKKQLKDERLQDYGEIQSLSSLIITPLNLATLAGKNFVYDLEPFTRILSIQEKLRRVPLIERLRVYFESLSSLYNGLNFNGYIRGPILINLDEYNQTVDLNKFQFYDYMMLLLKKSDNIIEKIMTNVEPFEILLYTEKGYVRLKNTDLVRENRTRLLQFIKRLKPAILNSESKYDNLVNQDYENAVNKKFNLTGNTELNPDEPSEIGEMVHKKVSLVKELENQISKENEKRELAIEYDEDGNPIDEDESAAIDDVVNEIGSDEDAQLSYIDTVTKKKIGTKSEASLKRDKLLRERQMQIKMNGKTIGELVEDIPEPPKIPVTKINTDTTDNEELKNMTFYNFEEVYQKEMFDRDMARAITCYNDKTFNVNVTSVKVEDTSTEMVYQDTYTIEFEDENRKRHTMKVNIPKLIDNKFLIINGKKKVIQKQLYGLPVIKTGPDSVQIITNYNKLWIYRIGTRFNPNMERFKKLILDETNPTGADIKLYKGDNSVVNQGNLTCLEYDELAMRYNKIVINDCTFVFSIDMLKEELGDKYKDGTLEKLIIGYRGKQKTPIVYDMKNPDNQDMISLIVNESMPDYMEEFKKISSGRKYIHNEVKIMEKLVPVVIIVSYFEGLSTVIQKFNTLSGKNSVEFVDTKSNQDNYMYIRFQDGYLRYPMNDLEACIMFNGFTSIDLKGYTIADMDDRDTYLDIFDILLGSAYVAGGFINYYDFMIDYKTLDILKLLHYPEDIVSLMIYASNLLADSHYTIDTDPVLYRLRDAEIIPAILYKNMAKAYQVYRKTANNANPKKLSVDPDCVIKELTMLTTVENYSKLSPIVEVKTFGVASMKGLHGMNKDRSYNEEKRNYHDNMAGIIGLSTDISGNCGKERHLVLEPNVVNAYGMFDVQGRDNMKNMDATKILTAEEMTYPMGVAHDDPNRTAMTSKQSCHAIPVKDQCPCLITNGFDSTIQYRTSNDFSYVAKQDGEVIDRDDTVNIMVIKYKDGTIQAIDLDPKVVQNGGGGFYLNNKLDSTFKKGDKFKKDAILAFDKNYYKDTGVLGNKLTYGTLVKCACLSNQATYEDSMWSDYRISRAMSADIVMKEINVVLGKNSNVSYIVKVGDRVSNGDDLIRFDTSYSDSEMNELLGSIRSDLQEDIINLGKTKLTTKHDGVVADIRVYPAVDKSEMSPSLRKIVNDLQKHEQDRRKFMDKYDDNKNSVYRSGIYFDRSVDTMQTDKFGKIAGDDVVDGVKIEIYVSYHDEVSDGDKFAHMSANKATNGYMIPRGFEPYTPFRPYEEIDIPLAPSAILQRGTPSVLTVVMGYKVLIELKRSCYELLTGLDWNEKQRIERPYMDVHGKKPMIESTSIIESASQDIYELARQKVINTEEIVSEQVIESSINQMISRIQENINTLEDVFDIVKTQEDGRYSAGKEISRGEIVFAGLPFQDDLTRKIFETNLTINEGYVPNVEFDELSNAYIAKDLIYYGERFVISK